MRASMFADKFAAMSRYIARLSLLGAFMFAGCGSDPPVDSDEFTVSYELYGTHMAAIGEVFAVDAKIELDGQVVQDYEWRWTINTGLDNGHRETGLRVGGGVERVEVIPDYAIDIPIWGQVGVREDDGEIDWAQPVRGPTLRGWGGPVYDITANMNGLKMAVGERRPVFAQAQSQTYSAGSAQYAVVSHKPLMFTSEDPSIATVSPMGAISALSPGRTTITASVDGVGGILERTWRVNVDASERSSSPGMQPIRADVSLSGVGVVDQRGYPTALGSTRARFQPEIYPPAVDAVVLASWTGTQVGAETASRPFDRLRGEPVLVRGFGEGLHVVYLSDFPTPRYVVASRPLVGGPDDWTHIELDWETLIGDEESYALFEASTVTQSQVAGVRPRAGGGVWVAVATQVELRERAGAPPKAAGCVQQLSLVELAPGGPPKVQVVFEESSDMDCVLTELAGSFVLRPSAAGQFDVLGVVLDGEPSQFVWDASSGAWRLEPSEYEPGFQGAIPTDDPAAFEVLYAGVGWLYEDRVIQPTDGSEYPEDGTIRGWAAGEGKLFAVGDYLLEVSPRAEAR